MLYAARKSSRQRTILSLLGAVVVLWGSASVMHMCCWVSGGSDIDHVEQHSHGGGATATIDDSAGAPAPFDCAGGCGTCMMGCDWQAVVLPGTEQALVVVTPDERFVASQPDFFQQKPPRLYRSRAPPVTLV